MNAILQFVTPQFSLLAFTVLFTVDLTVMTVHGQEITGPTELLWLWGFALLLTWWVQSDRKARKQSAPFEYGAFVFFAWPLVVPYYLYRTRGRKGLLWGLGVWGLNISPALVSGVVHAVAK